MTAPDEEHLLLVASTTLPQADGSPQRLKLLVRRLDVPDFAGPGEQAGTMPCVPDLLEMFLGHPFDRAIEKLC